MPGVNVFMIVNLLFLFSISSGSVFAAVLWKKEFEDILPITVSGIILSLFLGGTTGYLKESFWIVFFITLLLWGTAIFFIFQKRSIKDLMKPFFSESFWIFLLVYFGLNFVLVFMKMHEWDEFFHWGTVVKAMVQTNSLGTSPQAHMIYGSYPLGMVLFQYYCLYIGVKTLAFQAKPLGQPHTSKFRKNDVV